MPLARRLTTITAAIVLAADCGARPPARHDTPGEAPPPAHVYSERSDDPWNRIFSLLFTRTVRTRMTDDFPDAGPFTVVKPDAVPLPVRVSTRIFERHEDGDRGIDALYPAFLTSAGLRYALAPGREEQLTAALTDALNERTVRSPIARAVMQADLWSAFDVLAEVPQRSGTRSSALQLAAARMLPLVARLIRKLALTQDEIAALPDNARKMQRDDFRQLMTFWTQQ